MPKTPRTSTTGPDARELSGTWSDWLPQITDVMSREALINSINDEYEGRLDPEELQSWEDRGILPQPVQGGYPSEALPLIQALRTYEDAGMPDDISRRMVREMATAVAEAAAVSVKDRLAELQRQEKARRETWQDWIPEEGRDEALLDAEPLLTRDELVAELKQGSVDVTPRELTRWQSLGVIPYPQKRRHKSTTVGVYPQWAINTIHLLKSLQEQGYKLREIGPLLRGDTYHRFTSYPKTPRQQRDHDRRLAKQAFFPLMGELDPRIRSLARVYERMHGGQITQAEVRLIDDQGKAHVYPFLTSKGEDADEDIGVERMG